MLIIKLFLFISIIGWIYWIFFKEIKTNKKTNKTTYQEKIKKGKLYETFVANYYRSLNYKVIEHGKIKGYKDQGIDLIAENENEILLIQCKNYQQNTKWKIRQKDIKAFRIDCIDYINKNYKNTNKTIKKLFILSNNVLSQNAINYIKEKQKENEQIQYKIIPF